MFLQVETQIERRTTTTSNSKVFINNAPAAQNNYLNYFGTLKPCEREIHFRNVPPLRYASMWDTSTYFPCLEAVLERTERMCTHVRSTYARHLFTHGGPSRKQLGVHTHESTHISGTTATRYACQGKRKLINVYMCTRTRVYTHSLRGKDTSSWRMFPPTHVQTCTVTQPGPRCLCDSGACWLG